jgi:RNA polymerase sigma factor (sigma-70 family)
MSEYELLKAFREERSEEAFAELVRRYAGLVYSVAKRRLPNASLAEDITQIVFIRFAKTPPALRNHAELAAWLHRTTVNVAIDTWRSETRRRTREQQAVAMEPATSENAVWEDISPNLDQALNQLHDEDRQALLLRFFGRKTMRDVGVALGVSEDAAKMRVSRALDRIRAQLGVRGAACTAAVLGTLLAERSVEAAPVQLVSRLAAMKLPAVAGVAGTGGVLGALLRSSAFKLAAGAVVLAVIGVSSVHRARSFNEPPPNVAMPNSQTNQTGNAAAVANREQFDSRDFNTPVTPPASHMEMMFHVVDASTAEGLANARIKVAYHRPGVAGRDVLTDNNGVAAIPIPESEDATKTYGLLAFVVAEQHVPKDVDFHGVEIPANYTMKLDPAMTAGGLVVDEHGLPVAGVSLVPVKENLPVVLRGQGTDPRQMENVNFGVWPVTTREDGSWSCSYIPTDWQEIRFSLDKPGYAATFPVVPVARVDLTNLVLVINRGFTVTGQMTDGQNRPVAKARIKTLHGHDHNRESATTDEHGVFVLDGVTGDTLIVQDHQGPVLETNESGEIRTIIRRWRTGVQGRPHVDLAIQAEGFAAQTGTVELLAATNVANFTLTPGNILRGRVLDEAGNPVSNAVIRTDLDVKNQLAAAFDWTSHTDGNGRFEWDSAPTHEICYSFYADGYDPVRGMPLTADGRDHEITLKADTAK